MGNECNARHSGVIILLIFFVDARMEKAKKAVDQVSNADQVKSPNQLVEKIRSLEMDYKTLQEKRLQDVSRILAVGIELASLNRVFFVSVENSAISS